VYPVRLPASHVDAALENRAPAKIRVHHFHRAHSPESGPRQAIEKHNHSVRSAALLGRFYRISFESVVSAKPHRRRVAGFPGFQRGQQIVFKQNGSTSRVDVSVTTRPPRSSGKNNCCLQKLFRSSRDIRALWIPSCPLSGYHGRCVRDLITAPRPYNRIARENGFNLFPARLGVVKRLRLVPLNI